MREACPVVVDRAEVERLLKDGRTLSEIADEVGCSHHTISHRLKLWGLPVPRGGRRLFTLTESDIEHLRTGGEPLVVARRSGVTLGTVMARMRDLGLTRSSLAPPPESVAPRVRIPPPLQYEVLAAVTTAGCGFSGPEGMDIAEALVRRRERG